jgi:hypothetical protein
MQDKNIKETYQDLAEKFMVLSQKHKKILFSLSMLRLFVFIGGAVLAIAGFSFTPLAGVLSLIPGVVLFLYLLNRFDHHSCKREFFANLEAINRNEIKALSGDLSPFNDGSKWINPDHDFSNDVDVFGRDSLFHFLNRTVTGHGRAILAGWLSEPDNRSASVKSVQEAVGELSEKLEWRQEFLAHGTGKSLEDEDIGSLLAWLKDESWSLSSIYRKIVIWIFPLLTLVSLALLIAGLIPYPVFTLFFLVNLLITFGNIRNTGKIHNQITRKHAYLSSLNNLLLSFEREPFKAAILLEIKNSFSVGEFSAVSRIKKLTRIIELFDTRLNLMVGFVLNGLFLWDFHCIRQLDKWKAESRSLLPGWLSEIGKIDALISLSNFKFNNPDFQFPVLSESDSVLSAVKMGHPMINSDKRVCNDFTLEKAGKVIIITGANMAGKSTFLRTVAVNYILAMIGAPACAQSMTFLPLKLFTSMRTTDSLAHNESYFYAELKRLRTLKIRLEGGEKMLFILDEILKGTNSADKSNGSKMFMKKIIELGGTGLVATHDTSLGEMENDYPGNIINKCFEIEIDGEKVIFDYILRHGITRKMNAALLMRQMGIA